MFHQNSHAFLSKFDDYGAIVEAHCVDIESDEFRRLVLSGEFFWPGCQDDWTPYRVVEELHLLLSKPFTSLAVLMNFLDQVADAAEAGQIPEYAAPILFPTTLPSNTCLRVPGLDRPTQKEARQLEKLTKRFHEAFRDFFDTEHLGILRQGPMPCPFPAYAPMR